MEIAIINYGLSNLLSVQRAFEHCNAQSYFVSTKEEILAAKALVLPGVGAFKDGMDGLSKLDLVQAIKQKCEEGTPLLGICLGMQMLFEESDEFGVHKGIGLIEGRVERIEDTTTSGEKQRVPHVGWSQLIKGEEQSSFENTVLQDISQNAQMYFVHSYEAKPTNSINRLANVVYGNRLVCATAQKGNVIGCQFHPEKSGEEGLKVIKSYIKLCEKQ